MRSLQLAHFAVACNTGRDTMTTSDSAGKPRRIRSMLFGWRLDATDDPTILFPNMPRRLSRESNPVVDTRETDERLWARHQAWDM